MGALANEERREVSPPVGLGFLYVVVTRFPHGEPGFP